MHPIPWQATHQFGVFTAEQAVACGWSPSALSRAVRGGRLVRVRQGAYSQRQRLDERLVQAAAVVLTNRGMTISHGPAGIAHGLALFDVPADRACLTTVPGARRQLAGTHLHRTLLPPSELSRSFDLSVTSVARTCVDLTREFGLASGLVAADSALRAGMLSPSELRDLCESSRGRASSPAFRKLLALADGRRESPLESVSALGLAALPIRPEPQVRFWTLEGVFLGRTDFYWEEFGVVGEADGRVKYSDDALWQEKQREEAFTRNGIVVVRWGMREAVRVDPMVERVQDGWRRAALLRSAGISPTVRTQFARRIAA